MITRKLFSFMSGMDALMRKERGKFGHRTYLIAKQPSNLLVAWKIKIREKVWEKTV